MTQGDATVSKAHIRYRAYAGETDLATVMALVGSELSEPYVIYTYRYFLANWPQLAFLAFPEEEEEPKHDDDTPAPVGVIVCKQDMHRDTSNRGYIAMLSVHKAWRKRGIASTLVQSSVQAMIADGADEVVLETEADNASALSFYASMGFLREKRLFRFYMNGKDAFRLVLPIDETDRDETKSVETTSGDPEDDHLLTTTEFSILQYNEDDDDDEDAT